MNNNGRRCFICKIQYKIKYHTSFQQRTEWFSSYLYKLHMHCTLLDWNNGLNSSGTSSKCSSLNKRHFECWFPRQVDCHDKILFFPRCLSLCLDIREKVKASHRSKNTKGQRGLLSLNRIKCRLLFLSLHFITSKCLSNVTSQLRVA